MLTKPNCLTLSMKVAYLLGSLSRGGTETLLLDVFRNASVAEFPFIGVHRRGGPLLNDFAATSPDFYCCAPRPFRLLSYLRRLRRLLLSQQVTIVHAQQSIDALYASLATLGTPIKVVQTFHGFDCGSTFFERMIIRLSILFSDDVCFVSNYQRAYYLKRYSVLHDEKAHVVYNGVDFSKLDSVTSPNPPLPTKIDPASRGMKLAMVGNFVRVRAQNSLLQFLLGLHRAAVSFDFYFIGKRNDDEPWRYDECVRFCKQHQLDEVHFLGSRSDVPQILHQLDAFVYATDHDTFGIAVVEAMAAGVPVFVNDYGVMTEITNQGEWATLYQTGDIDDLLCRFLEFYANPDAVQQKAVLAAAAVRERYSILSHLQQLYVLYSRYTKKN